MAVLTKFDMNRRYERDRRLDRPSGPSGGPGKGGGSKRVEADPWDRYMATVFRDLDRAFRMRPGPERAALVRRFREALT